MSDISEAFWNVRKIARRPWINWINSALFEEVEVLGKAVTYLCNNKPMITRRGNLLTLRRSGSFDGITVGINRVGDILLRTNFCLLSAPNTTSRRYRIANIVDGNIYWVKAGLNIDLAADKIMNGKIAPLNKRSDEMYLQCKYLARHPVKTLKHKTKTHHLLLRIDDPNFWGLTGRKLQCFILTASNDGIEIAKTCASTSTLYKVFRYDDATKLLTLLRNSGVDREELSQFIKANRWINEYTSSSLRKLLALWLLVYDSR